MGSVQEKVAYLQGLAKGLNVHSESAEGKLLLNMVDVLESVAQEMKDISLAQKDLENYVDSLDEDLEEVESIVYEDGEESGMLRVTCPNCNADITFETDAFDADELEVTCPTCGDVVYENVSDETGHEKWLRHPGI